MAKSSGTENIFQPRAPWRKRPRLARETAQPLVSFVSFHFQGALMIYWTRRAVILGCVELLAATFSKILHAKPGRSCSWGLSSTINKKMAMRQFQDPPFGGIFNRILIQAQRDFERRSAVFGGVFLVFARKVQNRNSRFVMSAVAASITQQRHCFAISHFAEICDIYWLTRTVICSSAARLTAQNDEILYDKCKKWEFSTTICRHKEVDNQSVSRSASSMAAESYTHKGVMRV